MARVLDDGYVQPLVRVRGRVIKGVRGQVRGNQVRGRVNGKGSGICSLQVGLG